MHEELIAQLALELIPGIGSRGIKQLISYSGSASGVFKAPKRKLLKIPGVGEKMAELVLSYHPFDEAKKIIDDTESMGGRLVHFTNESFPSRLKQAPDSPNILFVKGNGALNAKRSIAVIGTRKATPYGKEITDQIVSDLSLLDVQVISGLAYGIDIRAHKAAIKKGISTYAVIAGGLDRLYPSAHKKYALEMEGNGGIITESIPGTKPGPQLFPARNRIIAGMADAVIVVEAAEKGGALITAHQADSYHRPVFAVPGDIGNEFSRGCNKLIATQKALIYTGIEDLIYQLGWEVSSATKVDIPMPELSEDEERIFNLLSDRKQAQEIDLIAIQSQLSINQVAATLLSLEFKNLVKSLPGKKYQLSNVN